MFKIFSVFSLILISSLTQTAFAKTPKERAKESACSGLDLMEEVVEGSFFKLKQLVSDFDKLRREYCTDLVPFEMENIELMQKIGKQMEHLETLEPTTCSVTELNGGDPCFKQINPSERNKINALIKKHNNVFFEIIHKIEEWNHKQAEARDLYEKGSKRYMQGLQGFLDAINLYWDSTVLEHYENDENEYISGLGTRLMDEDTEERCNREWRGTFIVHKNQLEFFLERELDDWISDCVDLDKNKPLYTLESFLGLYSRSFARYFTSKKCEKTFDISKYYDRFFERCFPK